MAKQHDGIEHGDTATETCRRCGAERAYYLTKYMVERVTPWQLNGKRQPLCPEPKP